MTWDAFHRRADVLRAVVAETDRRRDGRLPVDLPGVRETFRDDADLVLALQLRWHTRLSGQVERALAERPADPEAAALAGWRRTARRLAGVRAVLDAQLRHPVSAATGEALALATRKDRALLATAAGRAHVAYPAVDDRTVLAGRQLEDRARACFRLDLAA